MKIFTFFTTITVVIALLFSLFFNFSLTVFVNVIFFIGMITLIYSGFRYLYEKGAFALSKYSMKKVTNLLFKRPDKDGLPNKKVVLEDYLTTEKFSSTIPLLIGSLIMIAFSIVFGFMLV